MAITDENGGTGMVMPVGPMGGFGMSNGFGGDGSWWIILLFILLCNGGWNNGGNGFGGGVNGLYPWMNQAALTQGGFDQAATAARISGIQSSVTSGFGDIQNALCNGFAGVANGFAQAEIANNARQMANMQSTFGVQTAITGGLNDLSRQFADCCCENRLASADLKYTIATENCADRYEASQNTRDIIDNMNRNNQVVLDKLCALELDAKNTKIADLERQLTMANLAASQTAQTGRLLADNAAQTVALEQYLNPTPIPAYVVQNPNCCPQNFGCGCGMA